MYDMSRIAGNGYFDKADSEDARYQQRVRLANQRTADFAKGSYALAGGVVDPLPDDAPQFVKDYYAYYKQPRGYHARSLNSNDGWAVQSILALPMHVFSTIATRFAMLFSLFTVMPPILTIWARTLLLS